MKKRHLAFCLFLLMVLVGFGLPSPVYSSAPVSGGQPRALQQATPPLHGWEICGNLGILPVPGIGIIAEQFVLCHADGWQVNTYCLEPDEPRPPIGSLCSRIYDDTFWCGEEFQLLQAYEYIEEAGPTPTRAPTRTPTPTVTRTPTPTTTPTPTPTRRPALPTAGPRVHPGGEGNLTSFLISISAALLAAALGGAALSFAARRPKF